jgi:transcriptional regulator with XRE-family HTH domain
MDTFARWLKEQYNDFAKSELEAGRDNPKPEDFAYYLGVDRGSYARWMRGSQGGSPINNENLLMIAVRLGSKRPFEIFNRTDILQDDDLVEVITKWRYMLPEDRRAWIEIGQRREQEYIPIIR